MDRFTNNEPDLDTNQGQPPRLDFLRRFIYDFWNSRLIEVERQTTGPLMTPMWSWRWFRPRALSNVAKLSPQGYPERGYNEKLPNIAVASVMIEQAQGQTPKGAGKASEFPFKLKAVGPVNAWMIFERAGQPGAAVSDRVEIIP